MLKLEIRGITIPYCSKKKAKFKEQESNLEAEVHCLEQELGENVSVELMECLDQRKLQLEQLRAPKPWDNYDSLKS